MQKTLLPCEKLAPAALFLALFNSSAILFISFDFFLFDFFYFALSRFLPVTEGGSKEKKQFLCFSSAHIL